MADLATETPQEEKVDEYQSYLGATVLWPAEMPDDMLEFTVSSAESALATINPDTEARQIADQLKKKLDERYDPHWHVVVGRSFASYAKHEKNRFVYFSIGPISFMIYKAGSG